MPVSNKEFSELMYDLLPEMYRTADREAQPNPEPLKRFLQVASIGMEQFEGEIDGQQLLFNVDLVPTKYLDPLGRMIGFNFPKKMTELEKRGLLKNLPMLYKLKGSSQVFDVIARIIFNPKNTKTSTDWRYTANTTTMQVILLLQDGVLDLEERMDRFVELIEYFRPINVGLGWTLEIYYEDELVGTAFFDDSDIDILKIDDNLFGQHEYTGNVNDKPRLLNKMRLNQTAELYSMLFEEYDFNKYQEALILDFIYLHSETDEYEKLRKYLYEPTFTNNKSLISGKSLLSALTESLFEDIHYDVTHAKDFDELLTKATHTEKDIVYVNDNARLEISELNKGELNNFIIGVEEDEKFNGEYLDENVDFSIYTTDSDIDYTEIIRLNYSHLNGTEVFGDKFRAEEIFTDIVRNSENEEFSLGKSEDNDSHSTLINLNYSLNLAKLGSTMILSKAQQVISYNY